MESYNIYCDESCHLEHDGEKVMVIGGIKCPQKRRKQICNDIYSIKQQHNIPHYAEIKWNKVSSCNVKYFKQLVDYFFDCEDLSFRAIVVDKTRINHTKFNQTHNDFYYKMYYQFLIGLISTRGENYIYLDKKDTKGTFKINQLKYFIGLRIHDFDSNTIKRIQCVNSSELPLLQLADLFIGAIGYKNRIIEHESAAKLELIEHLIKKSGYSLTKSTLLTEQKLNLFFINLQ